MVKTKVLIRKLAVRFPKSIAYKNHDRRIGLQTGKLKEWTSRIVLALDLDETIANQVLDINPDLVLTHHPFIFGPRMAVLNSDPLKLELVTRLDEALVPVYSLHTNFDEGKDGMNDALAEALGLDNIHPLETEKMARGGNLPQPMTIDEFVKYALLRLDVPYGSIINAGKKTIERVAIIGGGGSRSWRKAAAEGFDIFISGDTPHHVRRDIIRYQFNYLDVPHEVERIFLGQMQKILLEIDPTLEVIIIDQEKVPPVIQLP
ncbi:MAG: Nif3-like dinuclear metal center hexameric protein [Bacilli bacterium]|jgi:dinuclear metal center YbgI/SA1388 family protein|nr:Nif3-like dinuclear metal center hexameric protein [Bacilli bacterium]